MEDNSVDKMRISFHFGCAGTYQYIQYTYVYMYIYNTYIYNVCLFICIWDMWKDIERTCRFAMTPVHSIKKFVLLSALPPRQSPTRVIGRRRVLPLKIKAFHSRCFSTLWALSGTCASGRVTNLDLLKTFGFRSTIADRIWEHQSSHFWPFLQVARGKVAAQRSGFTSVDWTVANGGFLHPDSNCQVYGAVLRSCRMQGCLGLRGMVCLIGVPKGLAM